MYAKTIPGIENPSQNGFKLRAKATDNPFLLSGLIDIRAIAKKPLYICYIDFQSAFDKVLHLALIYELFRKGVCSKYFKVIKIMFDNSKSRVKYYLKLSDAFENLHGVLQGGISSPSLFTFFSWRY